MEATKQTEGMCANSEDVNLYEIAAIEYITRPLTERISDSLKSEKSTLQKWTDERKVSQEFNNVWQEKLTEIIRIFESGELVPVLLGHVDSVVKNAVFPGLEESGTEFAISNSSSKSNTQ